MKTIPIEVLDYANSQIDAISPKQKFSLGELTAVIDGLFALSGGTLSGSTSLVYVMGMRGLRIVMNRDETLTVVQRRSHRHHEVPDVFMCSPWFVRHLSRPFVGSTVEVTPLFKLGDLSDVVVRDVVWLRHDNGDRRWTMMQTSAGLTPAAMVEPGSSSVLMPSIVDGDLRLITLPDTEFRNIVKSPTVTGVLKRSHSAQRRHDYEWSPATTITEIPDHADFYKEFVTHVRKDESELERIPVHERTTLMHVLINTQMALPTINRLIF